MAYSKTNWANGTTPAISAANLNKIENGIYNNFLSITNLNSDMGNVEKVLKWNTNILNQGTLHVGKKWNRDGVYHKLTLTDNANLFSYDPIQLKAGDKIYTSNLVGSGSFILFGDYNASTGEYTGDLNVDIFTVQHYTNHDSDYEFRDYEFEVSRDALLFITCTTVLDLASPQTTYIVRGYTKPVTYPAYNMPTMAKVINTDYQKIKVVSPNGENSSYTSIQAACDNASDGDIILVMPGEYKEVVTCIDKEIHIVGLDKNSCILYYDSDQYNGGQPLSIAYGSVSNITIKAERASASTTSNTTPYAVHIDFDSSYNKKLNFDNVDMFGGWQAACGIGLKGGFDLSFKNCNFISDKDTTNGALFFHDNTITGYYGTANITFDNCNIINKNGTIAIMPTSYGSTNNTTNMRFLRTCIYSSLGGKTNACVGVGRAVSGSGWRQYNNFFLTGDSYNNNIALFNA